MLVEGARLGLDLGDRQLLDRYERWRGLDTLMVAMATDGLTRLFGIPGKLPSAVRRFGMAVTGRIAPLRDRLAAEARGTTGDLPLSAAWAADLTIPAPSGAGIESAKLTEGRGSRTKQGTRCRQVPHPRSPAASRPLP